MNIGDKVTLLPRQDEWRLQEPCFISDLIPLVGCLFEIIDIEDSVIRSDGWLKLKGIDPKERFYNMDTEYLFHEDWLQPVYRLPEELFEI